MTTPREETASPPADGGTPFPTSLPGLPDEITIAIDALMASVEMDGAHSEEEDEPPACRLALEAAIRAALAPTPRATSAGEAEEMAHLREQIVTLNCEAADERVDIEERLRLAEEVANALEVLMGEHAEDDYEEPHDCDACERAQEALAAYRARRAGKGE